MRKSLRPAIFCIAHFILHGNLFAQAKMKLSGTVSDSTKPLAYVTVRLLKKNSPTPLQTALTKENGNFQLTKPDTGAYILSFTHTGFAEKLVPITVGATDMQIDPVRLSKASGLMKEVVVTAQRPIVEQQDDKIIFNVEDDPTNKSETALDILRKTPFVTVDGEDNIKINGKSNFKVLLNGRETSMFARNIKEALRGFPGAAISKIEVITTPSAKYDGEGIGGLINIITKKKIVGYNGTLSSFSRTSDKMNNLSLNGNAKFGKIGISAFLNTGFTDPVLQHNTNTTIPGNSIFYTKRTLDGDQFNSSTWSFGNAELSYEIDSLNTVSLYTNIDSWSNKNVSDQTIITDFAATPSTVSYYDLKNKTNNPGINIGSDYIRRFKKKKDQEFSLRFLGEFGKNDSKLTSFQDNPGTDRYLMNNSYAVNNQYTIQADNSIPFKSGKLEGGLKAILRRASSDFQSFIKYSEAENYKMNTANTDFFDYRQDVISLYSMYSLRLKKSNFRFGARVEFTNVNGNFVSSNTKVKSTYTTLLPNIQWTNKISAITTLVLNYTKRLQRPFIWDLNPFVFNNDSLNISYGNPDLGPQTTHALGVQLRFTKGNTFAGINIEGSYSGNRILQYSSFDPTTGITETTSLNIGKEFQSSLNLNLSAKPTPKWSLFINSSIRYIRLKSNIDPTQSNNGVGVNFNMNNSYRFSPKFMISSFIGLWKDPQTIQTTFPFTTWHNVAFNYKILNNKVNISLRAVNFLQKDFNNKIITEDKNFYNTNSTRIPRRAAVLALTWNFGKLTENVSKKKGVTNDDILTRPAAPTGN
jgi:outer membrane receptor protein involved in Fe transport